MDKGFEARMMQERISHLEKVLADFLFLLEEKEEEPYAFSCYFEARALLGIE